MPRRITVSMARKAVDSTFRRILNYTAEIIISIILLVTICIPLAFTIPMWFQHVFFNVPRTELTINPALWWGLDGTLWITLFLGLVSISIGYIYIMKMNPGGISDDVEEEDVEEFGDKEDEDSVFEDIETTEVVSPTEEVEEDIAAEDIPLEDQEADEEEEESILDDIEDSLEDDDEED